MHKLAIFDLDGTLVHGQSQHLLAWHLFKKRMLPMELFAQSMWWFGKHHLGMSGDAGADTLRRKAVLVFAGRPVAQVESMLDEFCATSLIGRFRQEALVEIGRQKSEGKRVIVVSAAIDLLVERVAELVGADGWVATRLERVGGRLTGCIVGPVVRGAEKYHALRRYADEKFSPWVLDSAYGDHVSDAPLLERANQPVAVCPHGELESIARRKGWHVAAWK